MTSGDPTQLPRVQASAAEEALNAGERATWRTLGKPCELHPRRFSLACARIVSKISWLFVLK